jgi:hypothetical protein
MVMKRGKRFRLQASWYYYPEGNAVLQVKFGGKWMDTTVTKMRRVHRDFRR